MQNLKFSTRIQQFLCLWGFTLLMGAGLTARAATIVTLTVASNNFSPWICPPGLSSISVALQGGGGGGGAGQNNNGQGGGGGGGACAFNPTFPVTPGQAYSFSVGGGGPGASAAAGSGTPGGNSTFATLMAGGGGGGKSSTAANQTEVGGAGGRASDSVSQGTVLNSGGAGGGTTNNGAGYGAGGGGAGTAGVGNPGSGVAKGIGGLGGAGQPAGGQGANAPAAKGYAGTNCVAPGGGGSGGWRNTASMAGGAGADGQIVLVYTIPTFPVIYDANGGTGSVPSDPNSPYAYGSTVTVLEPGSLTNAGYVFNGWNTAPAGGGTAYAPEATMTNLQANVTLYAQWVIPPPAVLTIETAADGTGASIRARNVASGTTVTGYAVVRTGFGVFITNAVVSWSLGALTGGVGSNDLVVAADNKSATFTGKWLGSCRIQADSGQYGSAQSGLLTVVVGAAAQFGVETAADGSGTLVAAQNLGPGGTVAGYAIARDGAGNFVTNATAAWSLANRSGGVVSSDLAPIGNSKSALFTGHQPGSATLQATVAGLPAAASGTLTVLPAWTLVGDAGAQAGDERYWVTNQSAASLPPDCNMFYCPGGILPTAIGNRNLGSFWIGETEVTYDLWTAVYGWAATNGYHFQNAGHYYGDTTHPVDTVSWRDAVVWCNALSERAGLAPVYVDLSNQIIRDSRNANSNVCDQAVNNGANGFRLPSQWEWECAARWQGTNRVGGAKLVGGTYWTPGSGSSGSQGETNEFALYANFRNHTLAVKSKQPNYLGCYDMSGNVGEWCFGTTSAGAYVRNWRGGPYYQHPRYQGVSMRLAFFPYSAGLGTGFRLALSQVSLGRDYVVSGGAVSGPVRAPARVFTSGRVGTNFHWEDEKMACLEDPDDFPLSRAGLGTLKLEQVGEGVYADNDPALGPDMDQINQMLFNLFQADTEVFGPMPIEPASDRPGNCGYTPARVANMMQDLQEQEALGRKVYGGWFFREDAFLSPHWVTNGDIVSIDTNYYGGVLYTPPFPNIDRRILAPGDIQNLRAALAASSLNCKTNFKIVHLLLAQTMLKLLHPELYSNLKFTPQEGAACLEYLRTNFDGIGEEQHINGLGSMNLQSMGTYSQWSLANNKISFMFIGGGGVSVGWGLGYARTGYESVFSALQAQGVAPNSTNLIWFRQAGFQGEHMLPENIDDDSNSAILTATAWLDKRLSGPLIINTPSLTATNGLPWGWQPLAACFGANQLSWSLAHAPAGMTVNPNTGLVQWTPGANDDSSGPVTLTVTNSVGLGGSDAYVFEVVLPTVFDLGTATLTSSNAILTLANQNIGGVLCTIKLVMTGYSPTHNNASLGLGTGARAGGLVVTDGGGGSIDNGEGINFDIQVVGPVTNLNFEITQFTIAGSSSTARTYSLTDQPGTTNGFAGNEFASGGSSVTLGTGIPVAVTMDSQPLRDGFDFAWNRTSGGGPAMGLKTLTILVTGTSLPTNTVPTLGAISNRALLAGQTLSFTNLAADADLPAQTLTFSLLNAPAGAAVDSSSGVFTWRPAIAQSPSTNTLSVVVRDNGSPSLSATQSFSVTVNQPRKPSVGAPAWSGGHFIFTVSGDQGPDYQIFASANLTDWLPVWTNVAPTLPFQFTDPGPTNFNRRFYRVLLGP